MKTLNERCPAGVILGELIGSIVGEIVEDEE